MFSKTCGTYRFRCEVVKRSAGWTAKKGGRGELDSPAAVALGIMWRRRRVAVGL
jgi:hypothetical protein